MIVIYVVIHLSFM